MGYIPIGRMRAPSGEAGKARWAGEAGMAIKNMIPPLLAKLGSLPLAKLIRLVKITGRWITFRKKIIFSLIRVADGGRTHNILIHSQALCH